MVIVVTGGCSGVGEAIALAFLTQGYNVEIIDRKIKPMPCPVHCIDVLDFELIKKLHLDVEVLVHCAGILDICSFKDQNPTSINEMLQINLYAPMILTQIFLPSLIKNKGSIVNIISSHIFIPKEKSSLGVQGCVSYTAIKSCLRVYKGFGC